ncbi:MAG: hypothetical protein FJ143_02535 [Deltaproteobacteria bacterium]|nr:hypothetical protein [Deltaproteobacteria bacterium]
MAKTTVIDRKAAAAAVKKHGGVRPAAKAIGMCYTTFHDVLSGVRKSGKTQPPPGQGVGRKLEEFRDTYDKSVIIPRRIRDGLKTLNGGWLYEVQFAKHAGVSLPDLSNFREQFAEHLVVVRRDGKRAWAATPAIAAKMREMLR